MRALTQVSCSLNLGLIYSVDYSYSPHSGVSIKLFFVSRDGNYPDINLLPMQKVFIRIGSASFTMYPVASEIDLSAGRRVMSVDFVDDFYRLSHYYVVLPNRGCGANTFTLGSPVDTRTSAQKVASAIDPIAQQIKELTQYPDYEYTFNAFLTILRAKFPIQINAAFDTTVTQAFEGSFATVLSDWCNYYNLSFFFENGFIKIFDPTRLFVNLPTKPIDAISYNVSQDIRSTYGKTVCNWFQQDGGEYPLNQTSNTKGPLLTRTATLYPQGYEHNLSQPYMDPLQVAAAMYGQNYWFLYNYYQGTTSDQCGFTPISKIPNIPSTLDVISTASKAGGGRGLIAIINQDVFNQRFDAYQQYGQSIAGRWYLSDEKDDLAIDQGFKWFDESAGQIFDFTNVDNKSVNLSFLTPTTDGNNIIQETAVNNFYPGVSYVGNRIAYRDAYDAKLTGTFNIGGLQGLVDTTYASLTNIPGSNSVDFNALNPYTTGACVAVGYIPPLTFPQDISLTFANLATQSTKFNPRFASIPLKGISTADYTTLKAAQKEPNSVSIVKGNDGPTVITNTSVIKTQQQGTYTVYYDKYSQCASASTPDLYFDYQFDPRQVSTDNQIGVTFTKRSNNSYKLNRDYAFINGLVNNPLLQTLAQPRIFPTRTVTFTVNYFYDIPIDFLTQGLVSMSVSIGDGGVLASYAFSNEVLRVPDRSSEFTKLAQAMKNTWTRTYRPKETIA